MIKSSKPPKDRLLPRLTLTFFNLPKLTAILWIALTLFGILSYASLLRREGFPSVQIPIAIVNGTYFVNDPAKVDADVTKLLIDAARDDPAAKKIDSESTDNFFSVVIEYKEGTDAKKATERIKSAIAGSNAFPDGVHPTYSVPNFGATGPDVDKIDVAVSLYDLNGTSTTAELVSKADNFARELKSADLPNVLTVGIKNPVADVVDPRTGQPITVERSFDRFGRREDGDSRFYQSILVTISAKNNVDVIKLDKEVRDATATIIQKDTYDGYSAAVSASFAPSIVDNLSELQKVLLEGLVAVLVVGSIVIAVRASFITVLSMATVILTTIGLLYLIGYTLNVITLFGLILGLSLIVDDTIIMVEAIEAARRKTKTAKQAVALATRKVSRAMVAATVTAALCFLPLAMVGGVLGSFIRAIPVTIIASLFISLLVALIFIPFFSRFLLLSKKQLAKDRQPSLASKIESGIADGIIAPMHWAQHSKQRLIMVGIAAIIIGVGFIGAGLGLSQKVAFNIFPPTKDTNGLIISLAFPEGTDLTEAQKIATEAEKLTAKVLGDNFVQASYFASGSPQSAIFQVELIPYSSREVTAPELASKLKATFDTDFKAAQASVGQLDIGPPAAAFNIQIKGDDREAAYRLATDLQEYLRGSQLKRPDGSSARFIDVKVSNRDQVIRSGVDQVVQITSSFDGTDTTTLVTLAQNAINEEFSAKKLQTYGLGADAISFDLGQESDNQDSFKSLAITFPLLLLAIYILLILEFRSLLQPLLIFMAIPFSIFGLMLGLYLTDNAISFFASLGFFALIGLSIKNTILLTDFANQSRTAGLSAVESAAAATKERFRPLVATSLTAIVSLVPLALTSPFWQGLAIVLIFGLASSTILVLLVFPYYYLGVEYLRAHVSRKRGLAWTVITIGVAILTGSLVGFWAGFALFSVSLASLIVWALLQKRSYGK